MEYFDFRDIMQRPLEKALMMGRVEGKRIARWRDSIIVVSDVLLEDLKDQFIMGKIYLSSY